MSREVEITVKLRVTPEDDARDTAERFNGMTLIGSQWCEEHGTVALVGFLPGTGVNGSIITVCALDAIEKLALLVTEKSRLEPIPRPH